MYDNDKLDWSMAEHLAYGSLLERGIMLEFQDKMLKGVLFLIDMP